MLHFNQNIHNAISRSAQFHHNQVRKMSDGTSIPYATHPFAVALILSEFTHDEATLIAALLHDLPEDTEYTLDQLKEEFGQEVYDIVYHLTEVELSSRKQTTWEERKENYLSLLKKAPEKTLLVVIGDKIHNLSSMMYAYKITGDSMWNSFNDSGRDKQLWFHGEVLKIIQERIQHPLVQEHERVYQEALKTF